MKKNIVEPSIYQKDQKAFKPILATHSFSLAAVESPRYQRKSAMRRVTKHGLGGRKP